MLGEGVRVSCRVGLAEYPRALIKQDDIIAEELKKCSGSFKYTRWDKYGHGMANKFLGKENWTEWMFSQSLDKR